MAKLFSLAALAVFASIGLVASFGGSFGGTPSFGYSAIGMNTGGTGGSIFSLLIFLFVFVMLIRVLFNGENGGIFGGGGDDDHDDDHGRDDYYRDHHRPGYY